MPTVLQRIAAGEQGAVAESIDAFGGLVWHLARRLLSGRADLEDAVQEVFVELWKAAPKYDPSVASEQAFVAVIARRRLIDRARRERTRIGRTVNIGEDDGVLPGSRATPPAEPVERTEEARRAAEALQRLTPEQQQALRLSIYDGLSHQEIADRLKVPLGTVKTNIRRGLIRIREALGAATLAGGGPLA